MLPSSAWRRRADLSRSLPISSRSGKLYSRGHIPSYHKGTVARLWVAAWSIHGLTAPYRRASHLVRVLLSGLLVPALGTGAVWGAGARQVHAVTPFEAAGTSLDDARAASAQRNTHKCKLQRDSQFPRKSRMGARRCVHGTRDRPRRGGGRHDEWRSA